MSERVLVCAIEDIHVWHPRMYLEAHAAAFVSVAGHYARMPARFRVECARVKSNWLAAAKQFTLEVAWTEATIDKAERLRATLQQKPLVELAAVAVALILAHRIL